MCGMVAPGCPAAARPLAEGAPTPSPLRFCLRHPGALLPLALLLLAGGPERGHAQASPLGSAELRREAERLRGERRLAEALAAYEGVVALEPSGFEDRFWVAKLQGWTGRHEEAERAFAALLAERPGDYDTGIALADVRRWRGDTAGARLVLDDLRHTRPGDPEVLQRLAGLRHVPPPARWEADLEYFGERLAGAPATNGATMSLRTIAGPRFRWRAAATVQEKFDRTEARAGGEVGYRPSAALELAGSAFLAPGADVLPRQSYGAGVSRRVAPFVLSADYAYQSYRDAGVHQVGPGVELYMGRWLVAARYRYAVTRFAGTAVSADDHAGSLALGFFYAGTSLIRVFAATGGESFTQPSRDLIGRFDAHTVGLAWRHFLTPGLGLEALYARQDRSGGGHQDSYSLRVVRRW